MSTTTGGAVAGPSNPSSAIGKSAQPAYDFTKRKRWADLLLTELVDNIVFVLSPTGKILYCGNAVTELLGWRDVELVDLNFIDLVDLGDQNRFRIAFNDSLLASAEFNILVRLRHSDMSQPFGSNAQPGGSVLFEMKCYPHITMEREAQTRCLFGMAVPYPSRNTTMLDTILDLKTENDRLQHMVAERRARLPEAARPSKTSGSLVYATSTLQSHRQGGYASSSGHRAGENTYLSSQLDDSYGNSKGKAMADLLYGSSSALLDEPPEDGSKKKKAKRNHNSEQYVCVTCGRTDSPEWRKGPAGPKTLCNACGLRWAKQMRRTDEPSDSVVEASG
ncbi:hypothetical protein CPB83DRAFT_857045 [Crepidotus variabilis]|uniref:Uncharacterized protein n=1 Tax=Crepidotus variabilis TaxID=179855 RepID=A0A9P6EDQ4_9AGAR|nr:hypothetical protein CPB83DRAFT_857045 [Crepidotus variabilis]